MANDEVNQDIKQDSLEKKLEEKFNKMQMQLDDLIADTKNKDELLAKSEKDKQDLQRQYSLLEDTHKLLKDNISPISKEEHDIEKVFQNVKKEDLETLSYEEKKMMHDIITDEDY